MLFFFESLVMLEGPESCGFEDISFDIAGVHVFRVPLRLDQTKADWWHRDARRNILDCQTSVMDTSFSTTSLQKGSIPLAIGTDTFLCCGGLKVSATGNQISRRQSQGQSVTTLSEGQSLKVLS